MDSLLLPKLNAKMLPPLYHCLVEVARIATIVTYKFLLISEHDFVKTRISEKVLEKV